MEEDYILTVAYSLEHRNLRLRIQLTSAKRGLLCYASLLIRLLSIATPTSPHSGTLGMLLHLHVPFVRGVRMRIGVTG